MQTLHAGNRIRQEGYMSYDEKGVLEQVQDIHTLYILTIALYKPIF